MPGRRVDTESAVAVPRSPVSCLVTARDLEVIQDKPVASGGANEGMMASEHLLASLLACQLSTFHKVAAKRGADARALSIQGDLHFDDAGDIGGIDLAWTFEGEANDKSLDTLVRLTDKVCTISRVLSCPVMATWQRQG